MRLVDKVIWYLCCWEVIRVFIGQVDFSASSEHKVVAFQLELVDSSDDERNRISPSCVIVFFAFSHNL